MTIQSIISNSIKKYSNEYFGERILLCFDFLFYTNGKNTPKSEQNISLSLYNTAINKSLYTSVMPRSGMWQNEITIRLIEFATWLIEFAIRLNEFTIRLNEFAIRLIEFNTRLNEFTIRLNEFTIRLIKFTTCFFEFTTRSTHSSGQHLFKRFDQKAKIYSKKIDTLYLYIEDLLIINSNNFQINN